MLRIVLIDDEEPALEEISYVLKENFDVEIAGSFSDPLEALAQIDNLKPDGVFLDIEMPGMDGFVLAREILNINSEIGIIFVTAFDQYAVEAFEINALDYIMKPILEERLDIALKKIQASKENKVAADNRLDKIDNVQKAIGLNISKVVIWKDDEIFILHAEDIFFFTKESGSVVAVTKEGRFKTKDTLDSWEDKLSKQGFFRSHRSYLINLNKVNRMSPWFNNTYVLYLDGVKETVSLSRNRVKEFKKIIGA